MSLIDVLTAVSRGSQHHTQVTIDGIISLAFQMIGQDFHRF